MSMESAFPWPPSTPLTHEERVEMVSRWRKMARRLIIIRQKKSKLNYDHFRKTDLNFQIGELVLIARRLKTKNTTKKFIPRFVSPYQVYRKVSPTCYAVEDLPCFRRKRLWRRFNAHFSQIRRYSVRRETEWCPYSEEYENCDEESDEIGITPNKSRPIENQPYEPSIENQPSEPSIENQQFVPKRHTPFVSRAGRAARPINNDNNFIYY